MHTNHTHLLSLQSSVQFHKNCLQSKCIFHYLYFSNFPSSACEHLGLPAKHNVTLDDTKCLLRCKEIQFLEFRVSGNGIQPIQSNVDSISTIPAPTTVKELISFLGLANYYLKFIPNYTTITAPLRNLLKKGTTWNWTEQCQASLEQVKASSLTTSPVLSHFSSSTSASTVVTCDASATALGAVLSHEVDGQEKPIAYALRALTDAEKKYSLGERETLACIWACENWHVYLYGRHFTLRTDHQSLTTLVYLSGTERRSLCLHRWSDRLHQYTVTTCYKRGSQNRELIVCPGHPEYGVVQPPQHRSQCSY